MRVLVLNQFFWPDAAATSQLLTDVARGLRERGHEVHVIAADRGYAIQDSTESPDVQIHRVKSVRFGRGLLGRVASYASFFLGCAWRGLQVPRPDVVVTLTTPPLLSLIGNLLRAVRGSRHFIWEMDVYPDVAVDLQYIASGGIADRFIGALADFSRRRSSGILALGPCMSDRLSRRGIPLNQISIAENWADSSTIHPAPWPDIASPLTVLYSGNLGLAHDVNTISDAMFKLQRDKQFHFVFAGSGARRAKLEQFCRDQQIRNAEFRPYSAKAALGESLGRGHIGLITQQESCLGSVVPSKVYGILAAGRPVLFIGPKESTVALILARHQCGWHIDCGDVPSLLSLLTHLQSHRSQVEAAGARARQAFLTHYDMPIGVGRVCSLIGASSQEDISEFSTGVTASASSSGSERFVNSR